MKPPEVALRDLVVQWLDKAAADLEAAEHLSGQAHRFGVITAFHCQQAVEKYLKAFLVRHQLEFPKTHDIAKLLVYVATINTEMAGSLRDAEFLTTFGVEMRYPGDAPELLPGGERESIDTARHVRNVVMDSIQAYLDAR
jgi:HEPN domain-containing protein